jgi:type IV fimbrial biogenesis protein FimT
MSKLFFSSKPPNPAGRARGFTLIELMVTVAVLAIVLSLAAPSFASLMASNRMSTQTNEFIGALNLARSEALRRAQPVTLLSADNDNYSRGWTVFPDLNGNGAAASATDAADGLPIRENSAFGGRVTIRRQTCTGSPCTYADSTETTRMYVVFTDRGAISSPVPAYFKVCDPSNPGVKGRLLQVGVVGKISLLSTDVTCT